MPENRHWLSVETAVLHDKIVRVGMVATDEGVITLASTGTLDGQWEESWLVPSPDRFGLSGRLLSSASGLVYAMRDAFWSSTDGINWHHHPIPASIADVPFTAILGDGPFMVSFFGTAGSFTDGNFRTVNVLARSDDALHWSAVPSGFLNAHGEARYHAPWFTKVLFPPPDGPLYISQDAMEWTLFEPSTTLRVAQTADNERFAMGTFNSRVYVYDKVPPLPAPEVNAANATGGIQLSWEPVTGASYYVVITHAHTYSTSANQLFVEMDPSHAQAVTQILRARVVAVCDSGHPGIESNEATATAFNSGLADPVPPSNLKIDVFTLMLQFTLSWRAEGGSRLHSVAWSQDQTGHDKENLATMILGNSIIIPTAILPPCTDLYFWVSSTDGFEHSAWAGPIKFANIDGNKPCIHGVWSVQPDFDPVNARITAENGGWASGFEVQRTRAAHYPNGFRTIGSTNSWWFIDPDIFFDTEYYYRIRSYISRPFLSPFFSAWSEPYLYFRPPTPEETLVLIFMGWTSLGNGRFYAEDFGFFEIAEEGSDWMIMADGTQLYVGDLDDNLYFIGYLPHPMAGWVLFPIGQWPFVYAIESQSWLWVAPGGHWVWNFNARRWVARYRSQ